MTDKKIKQLIKENHDLILLNKELNQKITKLSLIKNIAERLAILLETGTYNDVHGVKANLKSAIETL